MIIYKPWVQRYLVSVGVCKDVLAVANEYEDPQAAWIDWGVPEELLWAMFMFVTDRKKALACLAEIVTEGLFIYTKKYPDDLRVQEAVKVIRKCSENDSSWNWKAAKSVRGAAEYSAYKADAVGDYAAAHAANAVSQAACAASVGRYNENVGADAARRASEHMVRAVEINSGYSESEQDRQLKRIYKYFPRSPVSKEA